MRMDPITDVVSEAKQVIISQTEFWSILVAFVFGGFTSAIWTWKEAVRKPKLSEVISTLIVSGLIAVVIVCLMLRWSPNAPMIFVLAISIMCGFSGDILVRPLLKGLLIFVNVLTGKSVLTASTKETEQIK